MKLLAGRRAAGVMLLLVLLVGAGNLWASYDNLQTFKQQQAAQQAQQQRAGERELAALCTDVGTMAHIPPPAGDPSANPSRAYSQAEHRAWMGLYAGLSCH